MSGVTRRSFLSTTWKVGFGFLAVAGALTSWDLLKPRLAAGFAALVGTVPPDDVPETGVMEVREARGYLVNIDGDVIALSEKCPHLGCRVPFIDDDNRFECPCHGSQFTREGDYIKGPAPRGLDEMAIEIVDGVIEIDTTDITLGPAPGTERT